MIRYESGHNIFNYRVVGVAFNDQSVLLHKAEGDDFWLLPGGRVEFGESAEQALIREMREEIDVEVEIVRLLWLVENFFTYENKRYHEIALYFLMQLPVACNYLIQPGPFQAEDGGIALIFRWFPCQPDVLHSLPLLPGFLQTSLQVLPESPQHVIQNEL